MIFGYVGMKGRWMNDVYIIILQFVVGFFVGCFVGCYIAKHI